MTAEPRGAPAAAARLHGRLPKALRQRSLPALLLLACVVVVLAGALVPVGGSVPGVAGGAAGRLPAGVAVPKRPDISAFLANRRWGVSLLEERQRRQEQQDAGRQTVEPSALSALQALGFVGVAVNAAEQAVLFTSPEGDVIRVLAGDALADGRVLVSVRQDAVVLQRANAQRETLLLFPKAAAEN